MSYDVTGLFNKEVSKFCNTVTIRTEALGSISTNVSDPGLYGGNGICLGPNFYHNMSTVLFYSKIINRCVPVPVLY